jgi:hypothetical protein
MAKSYEPDELATRTFLMTTVGIGAFIAVILIFIL